MHRRLVAAGLFGGHFFIHTAFPLLDLMIHGIALLILIWGARNV
jgi:hypothetical protein